MEPTKAWNAQRIIARGAAFSFRAYGDPARETQRPWGPVFAVSSLLTPLLLALSSHFDGYAGLMEKQTS